jgi:hypothetical protein
MSEQHSAEDEDAKAGQARFLSELHAEKRQQLVATANGETLQKSTLVAHV